MPNEMRIFAVIHCINMIRWIKFHFIKGHMSPGLALNIHMEFLIEYIRDCP